MSHWFDDLTRTLGDEELPRRQAIQRISGIVAGVALSSWFSGTALAQGHNKNMCLRPCNFCQGCSIAANCQHNQNCYCLSRPDGKGACVCNSYCSSLSPCTKQADCANNFSCIIGTGCGCTNGVCVPNCSGGEAFCHLDHNGAGRTVIKV